jgi:hypothetical protein
MAHVACSKAVRTCLCDSNIQLKDPLALIIGRSRNEQTPDVAAQTVGIEFTTRAAVATQPAVVGSSSSKTTSALDDDPEPTGADGRPVRRHVGMDPRDVFDGDPGRSADHAE